MLKTASSPPLFRSNELLLDRRLDGFWGVRADSGKTRVDSFSMYNSSLANLLVEVADKLTEIKKSLVEIVRTNQANEAACASLSGKQTIEIILL